MMPYRRARLGDAGAASVIDAGKSAWRKGFRDVRVVAPLDTER